MHGVIAMALWALRLHAAAAAAATSPVDCNFETPNGGATGCGYTNDKHDQRDWVTHAGPTPSANSGPDTDHTLGTPRGHYLYFETSGTIKGDRAVALSPEFNPGPSTTCQLRWWASMYGKSVGSLAVTLQTVAALGDSVDSDVTLWNRTGQQSPRGDWFLGSANFDTPSLPNKKLRIAFTATAGSGYYGDIAIDDVSLTCAALTTTTTTTTTTRSTVPMKTTMKTTMMTPATTTTTTPRPTTTSLQSHANFSVTKDAHVTASPGKVHENFTKTLTVNCTFWHGAGSDFSTLVSLLLSHTALDGTETELATITAFSQDHLLVKQRLGATVTGHLSAMGESYITYTWRYPGAGVLGRYRCEGFGLDNQGHPRDSLMEVGVSYLDVVCEDVLPRLKEIDLANDAKKAKIDAYTKTMFETTITYDQHLYLLSRPLLGDVEAAAAVCGLAGGYLAEVDDTHEFEFVKNVMTQKMSGTGRRMMLGGRRDGGMWGFPAHGTPVNFWAAAASVRSAPIQTFRAVVNTATKAPTRQTAPTISAPTTGAPTTGAPTTKAPTTKAPTTKAPTTKAPTTKAPTTRAPTTQAPTTQAPTTQAPTGPPLGSAVVCQFVSTDFLIEATSCRGDASVRALCEIDG